MTEAERFEEHGYVVIRGLLDDAHVAALTQEVDRIHRQWLKTNHAQYIAEQLVNMHSLTNPAYFRDDPAARLRFFEKLASPSITKVVDGLFGDGLYFHNTQLFFNPFENRRLPYWHRDLQYGPIDDAEQAREQGRMCSLHVRIPLVREQGLELVPGTHRRWDTELEHKVRFDVEPHRHHEDLPGAVLIELEPGDALIFDAQMLHRGNYRLNPIRKALDLCIGKPHPFTSPYLDRQVLPAADELDRIENNHWYRQAVELSAREHPA